MKKILFIDYVPCNGRKEKMFCRIDIEDGRLSISGVIGPRPNGNAMGGAGQINMEFDHEDKAENDARYTNPILARKIKFADGWNKEIFYQFLHIWHCWHLNDMHPECEHQRKLGWKYEDHHDRKTFKGEKCPTCGYEIGSKWLKEELPEEVISFLANLPESPIVPAWV